MDIQNVLEETQNEVHIRIQTVLQVKSKNKYGLKTNSITETIFST